MMRVTFSGPRLGKSSTSIPNFSLNLVAIAFRNSLLAGMPTTRVPSFFAAARVRSHCVCQSAARRKDGRNTASSTTDPKEIQFNSCTEHPFLWSVILAASLLPKVSQCASVMRQLLTLVLVRSFSVPPNGLLNFEPRLPFGDVVKGFRLH